MSKTIDAGLVSCKTLRIANQPQIDYVLACKDLTGSTYWSPVSSGGGVSGVGATAPLLSTGGAMPVISLSGVVSVANGGTNSSTALTNNKVMVSGAGSIIESALISTTELSFLDGVTTNIQTQINNRVTTVGASAPLSSSGGVTPVLSLSGVVSVANGGTNSSTALTNNKVMVSIGGAVVESSLIDTTELSYLNGVTSNIQVQINNLAGGGGVAGKLNTDFSNLAATTTLPNQITTFNVPHQLTIQGSGSGTDLIVRSGANGNVRLDTISAAGRVQNQINGNTIIETTQTGVAITPGKLLTYAPDTVVYPQTSLIANNAQGDAQWADMQQVLRFGYSQFNLWVQQPLHVASNTYTFVVRAKFDTVSSTYTFFEMPSFGNSSTEGGAEMELRVVLTDGVYWNIVGQTIAVNSGDAALFTDGKYHTFTCTVTPTEMRVYVDGVFRDSILTNILPFPLNDYVGFNNLASQTPSDRLADHRMAWVAVDDVAWTPAEVAARLQWSQLPENPVVDFNVSHSVPAVQRLHYPWRMRYEGPWTYTNGVVQQIFVTGLPLQNTPSQSVYTVYDNTLV